LINSILIESPEMVAWGNGAVTARRPAGSAGAARTTGAPGRFEIAVDATGVPAVVDGVADLLDRGGRLLVFGVTPAEATMSLSPFRIYNDEITVMGSMAILRSFAPAVDLIGSGAIDPRPLLSAPLPLDQFGEGLHRVRTRQGIKWHINLS
jgi:threonine dehydrogenase-like Zn-dependent dehydrogenase